MLLGAKYTKSRFSWWHTFAEMGPSFASSTPIWGRNYCRKEKKSSQPVYVDFSVAIINSFIFSIEICLWSKYVENAQPSVFAKSWLLLGILSYDYIDERAWLLAPPWNKRVLPLLNKSRRKQLSITGTRYSTQ